MSAPIWYYDASLSGFTGELNDRGESFAYNFFRDDPYGQPAAYEARLTYTPVQHADVRLRYIQDFARFIHISLVNGIRPKTSNFDPLMAAGSAGDCGVYDWRTGGPCPSEALQKMAPDAGFDGDKCILSLWEPVPLNDVRFCDAYLPTHRDAVFTESYKAMFLPYPISLGKLRVWECVMPRVHLSSFREVDRRRVGLEKPILLQSVFKDKNLYEWFGFPRFIPSGRNIFPGGQVRLIGTGPDGTLNMLRVVGDLNPESWEDEDSLDMVGLLVYQHGLVFLTRVFVLPGDVRPSYSILKEVSLDDLYKYLGSMKDLGVLCEWSTAIANHTEFNDKVRPP